MIQYRFIRSWRQFSVGDIIPASYAPNVIDVLLQRRLVEPVKAFDEPPKDKAIRRMRVNRK